MDNDRTYSGSLEDDNMLPDGYRDGDDFFDPDTWGAESGEATQDTADNVETASDAQDDPAIGQSGAADNAEQNDETGSDPAIGQSEGNDDSGAKFKVKYRFNHEDVEEEIREADLPELIQKARSVDRYKARAKDSDDYEPTYRKAAETAKLLGYNSGDEMLQALSDNAMNSMKQDLIDRGTPEEIAEDYLDRKYGRGADDSGHARNGQSNVQSNARDFKQEAEQLLQKHPELRGKTLPQEVYTSAASGRTLLEAYEEQQRGKQSAAEAAQLRKENRILKQNAASAQRAPVSGVTKGGKANNKPDDPFLIGFDSDDW